MANIKTSPVGLLEQLFQDRVRREAILLWKKDNPETVKRFHEAQRQFFENNGPKEAYDAIVNEIESSALAEYGERAEQTVRSNLRAPGGHPHGSPSPHGRE